MSLQTMPTPQSTPKHPHHLAMLFAVVLFASGCNSVTPIQTTQPPVEENSVEPVSPEVTAEEAEPEIDAPEINSKNAASNSAALLLLAKSETLRKKGQRPQAIGLVERAIRLEPRNGDLWVQLGRLNFEGGEMARAEQYARRGIALAKTDDTDQARADGWLLLADISEARGDVEGARQIRSRWLNSRG